MKVLAVVLLALVAGPALGETETCLDFECPNEAMDGGKFAVSSFSCGIVACFCSACKFLHILIDTLKYYFVHSGGTVHW